MVVQFFHKNPTFTKWRGMLQIPSKSVGVTALFSKYILPSTMHDDLVIDPKEVDYVQTIKKKD